MNAKAATRPEMRIKDFPNPNSTGTLQLLRKGRNGPHAPAMDISAFHDGQRRLIAA
jgi:hypothetical protein